MTRMKFIGNSPRFLFTGALLFLFILWMGSLLNFRDGWRCLVSTSDFDGRETFASESDFNEAMTDSFLPNDTMWIEDDSASRNSDVWITLSARNTIRIAGFTMAITFDTSFLAPEYWLDIWFPCEECPPETSWGVFEQRTDRTNPLTWNYWQGGVHNRHLDTTKFFGAIITGPNLPIGRGPLVRIRFKVKPYAPEGRSTPITFATGLPGDTDKPNTFADSLGLYDYIPITVAGTFKVTGGGGPSNQCPVFASMPSYFEVNQGATLEFDVTAYDPEGDHLTLYLDPLDAQFDDAYDFPTTDGDSVVTQTFTFSPTFAHTPGQISVKFKAEDELGCLTERTVSIQIIETTQDLLIASSEQGGVPGSAGRMVPFVITNSIPIYGFQFTLRWDPSVVTVDSFVISDVTSGFPLYTNLKDSSSSGNATVLIFGLASQTIPAGIETVLYAAFSVDESAPPGQVDLQLEDAVESVDPELPSKPLGMLHGKFTIDLFGDAIIDGLVDIADVVGVVAYILDNVEFTSRQFLAADVTKNDSVNVADLVGIINIILHGVVVPSPSPSSYLEPMAIVKLDYEALQPGTTGEVKVLADLEVPVAGAQIRIDYDPEQLSFDAPRLSDWSDKFIAEYRDDKQGKLIVVLYSMSNDPISPGEGNILSLPAEVSPDVMGKINLQIGQIVLADENAVEIPVDDGRTLVPQAFELSQNYPNPFNPTTTIKFTLPARNDGGAVLPATLKIYNVLGEMVRSLVDEPMSPGVHQRLWDGKDDQGNEVASGVYFYRLKAGEYSETKKMVLLK